MEIKAFINVNKEYFDANGALLKKYFLGDLMQKRSDLTDCRSQLIAKALFARTQSVKDELFLRKDPVKTFSTQPENGGMSALLLRAKRY